MTQSATVWSRAIWPWISAARELGHGVADTLAEHGVAEAEVRDPDRRFSYPRARSLVEALVAETGRPDLGLVAAEMVEPGHFDLLELALRSAPNLEGAISQLMYFYPWFDDGTTVRFERLTDMAAITFVPQGDAFVHPAFAEYVMTMLFLAARRETGQHGMNPRSISFRHPCGTSPDGYERVFAAPVQFSAPHYRCCMDLQDLARPMQRANVQTHRRAVSAMVSTKPLAGLSVPEPRPRQVKNSGRERSSKL